MEEGYDAPKVSDEQTVTRNRLYLDFDGVGNYPVHSGVCERVKVLVRPPHELGFQQVAAATVVLKHAHVELHRQVWWRQTETSGRWVVKVEYLHTFIHCLLCDSPDKKQ